VVLPEMAVTGYSFDLREHVEAVAEAAEGPTFTALSAVAKAAKCWVVSGFPERDGDALFNSAHVIDPSGALAFTYRKTLLYYADEHWARPGDSGYRRFDTSSGSFGVGICMDLNDDAFLAWCQTARLDAVAFPTNWVEEGSDVWSYWAMRMDAMDAGLVAANTWGREADVGFTGRSAVLQRWVVLAAAPKRGDAVIRAKLG
jgi:predicted amidohydrolase